MKYIFMLLAFAIGIAQAAPPTNIVDLSPNIDSNSPAGTDAIGSTLDDYLRGGFAITRRFATNGAIASAASMNIGGVQAEFLTVSGTTGISALGSVASGVKRVLVFEDALSLAHSASLILPGAANITTAAGDVMAVRSIGPGTWRAESYMRASGAPPVLLTVTGGGTGVATLTTPYGLLAAGTTATGAMQTLNTGATTEILVGGGTSALPVWTTATGSGAPVRATSPTLTTPTLGVATATTINKLAFTTPATGSTLTIADGKTLTASNSLTLAGTDSTTQTFPTTSATIARTDAAQTFTGTHGFGGIAATTVTGTTATFSTVNGNTITTGTGTLTLSNGATASFATTLSLTGFSGTTAETPNATTISLGYLNIPLNSQSANYTTVLADAGKTLLHPSTDANARTFTIDGTVNYPTGTAITFVNMTAQVLTVTTTNAMYLCNSGNALARTVSQYGIATALKTKTGTGASGEWVICGTGLS